LRNRFKPAGYRDPQNPVACFALPFGPELALDLNLKVENMVEGRFGTQNREEPAMPSQTDNSLIASVDGPWLPPVSFGVKPYLGLCRTIYDSLQELEARYPSHRRLLTLEARQKQFKKKRRPK
jgi:hypothetical protein